MELLEKVAYLKGLMSGLELEADKKETKVFNAILDVLDDLASTQKNFPLMENATSSSCVLPADAASERITLEQSETSAPCSS